MSKSVDLHSLISLSDELISVLTTKKDGEALIECYDNSDSVYSTFQSSLADLSSQTEEHEKKIAAVKREIYNVKSETISDIELVRALNELEEKKKEEISLLEELRGVNGKLEELEVQRASLDERKINLQEREKNIVTTRNLLSLCASVTQIIPNLNDHQNISGSIIDKKKKRVETFKFPKSDDSSFEICNKIWKQALAE